MVKNISNKSDGNRPNVVDVRFRTRMSMNIDQ